MAVDQLESKYYGFNPPFLGGAQNVLSRQAGLRLIKNDILQLIRTSRGERYGRPNFGTSVPDLLFESVQSTDISRLEDEILVAIQTNDDRVIVDSITTSLNNEQRKIEFHIICRLTGNPLVSFFVDVGVNLA